MVKFHDVIMFGRRREFTSMKLFIPLVWIWAEMAREITGESRTCTKAGSARAEGTRRRSERSDNIVVVILGSPEMLMKRRLFHSVYFYIGGTGRTGAG